MSNRGRQALRKLGDLPEAERRLGPYRLVRRLGRGAFAPVWLASEVYGDTEVRSVALKLFALDEGPEGEARKRLAEEARLLARVEHPNIVRFYALVFDEARSLAGLAMEVAIGASLRSVLDRGPLPVGEVLELGAAIASALAAGHQAGLVHRDVKPENVVRTGSVWKLIDFGISVADHRGRRRPGPVVVDDLPLEEAPSIRAVASSRRPPPPSGTVGYLDPEIVSERLRAVPASDLYSLGAMLYEALTGALPAAAGTSGAGPRPEVLDGRTAPPPLTSIAPAVPRELGRLVDALVAPSRANRPKSAGFLANELSRIRRSLAGRAVALPPESVGPFRGLGRFEDADRDLLFGRAVEQAAAIELLRTRGVVLLLGPSGSGKSSLARAAILPAVVEGAAGAWPPQWKTCVVTPGADPHAALLPVVDRADLEPEEAVVALAERVQASGVGVLVFIDQLEELVTRASGASQAWMARFVARVAEQSTPGLRVLCAARRDLLDQLLALEGLGPGLVRGTLFVAPLSDHAWADVVDAALLAYGYAFEDAALKREVLAELAGAGAAMPLVQFALSQLWSTRDTSRRLLTREGLRAVGGIGGALERHAEQTLAALSREDGDAPAVVRLILLALTTPQGTRTSRPAAQVVVETGHPFASRCLAALEEARLLVQEEDALTLAHEALLVHWARVAGWVAAAREDRQLAGDVERDAAHWRASGDGTLLWRKRRLAAAEGLGTAVRLSPDATSFVRAARAEERRGRLVIGVASAVLALGAISLSARSFVASRREAATAEASNRAVSVALERMTRAEEQTRTALDAAEQANAAALRANEALVRAIAQREAEIKAAPNLDALRSPRTASRVSPQECSRCDVQHKSCIEACSSDLAQTQRMEIGDCWKLCDKHRDECKSAHCP